MNPQSFRSRLVMLVLLVLIPAGGLVFLANVARLETEREKVREQAVSAAKLAAATQAYFVKEARQLLGVAGQFQALLLSKDAAACEKRLANQKRLATDFSDFGLIEPDGTIFCHTLGDDVTGNIVEPALIQKVLAKPEFTMGNLHEDPLGERTIQFVSPLLDTSNRVARFIYASVKVPLLEKALLEIAPPKGGAIRVMDSLGNIVAQNPPSGSLPVGNQPSDLLQELERAKTTNFFEADGPEGARRVYAVSPVLGDPMPALLVHVVVPRKILFAEADAKFGGSLAGMLLIGGIVLGIAWWYSSRAFLRPVGAMLEATDRLASGDLTARTGLAEGKSELHILARRFDAMAETLAVRQRELQNANAEIRKSHALLEQRVQERTRELETLNSELEAFSYSVSHDLRAPLRHMDGYAQILVSDESIGANPNAQRYLGSISKCAQRMGTLIDDLLGFSRMARRSMSTVTIDTDAMVRELVAELKGQEPDRMIEWSVGALPRVKGDRPMIRQVWWNLLSNAVKYTRGREVARIQVSAQADENEIVFRIQDNGAGFNMRYADKLFGVFQRLHGENEFEGTGIGLANVRRIINRHGGRTWAEGEAGKGATFYFSLPTRPLEQG